MKTFFSFRDIFIYNIMEVAMSSPEVFVTMSLYCFENGSALSLISPSALLGKGKELLARSHFSGPEKLT